MTLNDKKIPEVTKNIVKQLHGKKDIDIKIWGKEFSKDDESNETLPEIFIESPKSTFFKKSLNRPPVYTIIASLAILLTAILLRPDLFPFLDYHNIYRTTSKIFVKKDKPITNDDRYYPQENLSSQKRSYNPSQHQKLYQYKKKQPG